MLSAILLAAALLTEAADTLQTSTICAERGISVSRTDTLSTNNTQSVTDLLLQSPGLVVADYGGAAGAKSVNLRGLGSPHTAIYIDGIKAGNVQSGQPDLTLMGLENFSEAIIDYAQNSVNFCTARPEFNGRTATGRFAFSGGSFGTLLPNGRLDFRLSDLVSLSVNAAGTISQGHRPNIDIKQIKSGVDLFGLTPGGEWMAKAFYSSAERGTPGSEDWPSNDRQQDRNAFVQGLFKKQFTPLYSLNLSAKASYDEALYKSEWGDSQYGQTELQLNTAQKFHLTGWLDLSAAAEAQWDALKATNYGAERLNITAIAGAALTFARIKANITLQYDGINDKGFKSRNILSPSADIRINILEGLDLAGFGRRAYRAATFNELYYPGYGNPGLRPEDAWLADLGLHFQKGIGTKWTLKAKLDGFYNRLTDKIVSAPSTADPNLWLPYNIGEVNSAGIDADAGAAFAAGEWSAAANARYTFQSAENVPYMARHTAVLSADASFKGWSAGAVWNWRGGRHDSYGKMPDWSTLDINFRKALNLGRGTSLAFRLSCRNIADRSYSLVTGYPMPGRTLLGGIEFKF